MNLSRVNSEASVDCGEQAVAIHDALSGVFAARIGCPDDLPHPQSAAREKYAHCTTPVIATGAPAGVLVANARSAAEFTTEDEQDVAIEAACVQVIQQCRDRRVECRHSVPIGFEDMGIDRMVIPICDWDHYRGENIWGGYKPRSKATFGGKSYGILAVGDNLYMWMRQVDNTHAKLAVSKNGGRSWQKADWHFPPSENFNTATFLQFGPGYTAARDKYVYSYIIRTENKNFGFVVHKPGKIDLVRVLKTEVLNRNAYRFFAGLNDANQPQWTKDADKRQPVFEDSRGVSWVLSVTYNAGLRRYLLTTEHTKWKCGNIGIFDAPEPWGPWTTVPYSEKFPGWTFTFSNKWTSEDGTRFTVIYTPRDSWATVRGRFLLR